MNERRLLVVDDDINICELLKDVAESCGYIVNTTVHVHEFQNLYPNFKPTAIMLDLSIGERDGVELLRFLSNVDCKAPIIMMSGHDEKVRASAFRLGGEYGLNMSSHLQKPLDVEQVSSLLKNIGGEKPFVNADNLHQAVQKDELVLHYQPIVSLKTKKLLGAEALIRWQPPKLPVVFPDNFIPLAEESGIIHAMTMWVIDKSFKQSVLWVKKGTPLNIHVNLSTLLLTKLDLPDTITKLAKEYGVNPELICFEVTETGVMSQPRVATDILTRLRVKNFSLALDDFGTGYSSLVELYRMPFREIKIDKSFVQKMTQEAECLSIVNSIIQLAHSLKMEVVAEGVETKEIWNKLAELGCDIAQGYFIERSMSIEDFDVWMSRNVDDNLVLKIA